MKPRRKKRDLIGALSLEEVRRLLKTANDIRPFHHALFSVGYHFGLRAGEYGLLRKDHLDLLRGELFVPSEKGSHQRTQELRESLVPGIQATLRKWLEVHPGGVWLFPGLRNTAVGVSRQSVYRMFAEVCMKTGIPKRAAYPHILKNSVGSHLFDAGASHTGVQDWLRHQSIQSTWHYLKFTEAAKHERDEVMAKIGRKIE